MKYFTSALVIAALCCANNQTNAIHLKTKTGFTDDLVKSLAEDMGKDLEEPAKEEDKKAEAEKPAPEKKEPKKKDDKKGAAPAKKDDKKPAPAKKAAKKEKKEDDEIPMDAAAIKAYSSVIADAAEDSEPQQPVIYHQVASLDSDEKAPKHSEGYNPDPMGSMIQNEISSIKDASIKAAKEKDE